MAFTLKEPRTLGEAIDSHENGFNLVRLICALLVVVYHCWGHNPVAPRPDAVSTLLAPHGHLGEIAVGIFFIVSGLFVTQSWMRDPHLLRFTVRRIGRIVPGLFVCLLLTTIVAYGWFSDAGWAGLLGPEPWRYVFGRSVLHWLVYIIPPEEMRIPGVLGGQELNGSLWTLYWEGRMYVMLALIGVAAVLPMRTWIRGAAIFLLLAAHLFPTVLSGYIWEVRYWTLFLSGMLIYTLAPHVRVGVVHVACALVFIALNWTRSIAMTPSGLTWFGIALLMGALALWIGTARYDGSQHIRRHDYSFGIYIYHWPIIMMLKVLLPNADAPALLGATLLLVVPAAMLSWHFVESPAQRLVRRLLKR